MNPLMLRQLWDADPSNCEILAKLLDQPVLQHALQLLTFAGLPRATGGIAPSDVPGHALQNARREGFYEFQDALLVLSKPTAAPVAPPVVKPWKHKANAPAKTVA